MIECLLKPAWNHVFLFKLLLPKSKIGNFWINSKLAGSSIQKLGRLTVLQRPVPVPVRLPWVEWARHIFQEHLVEFFLEMSSGTSRKTRRRPIRESFYNQEGECLHCGLQIRNRDKRFLEKHGHHNGSCLFKRSCSTLRLIPRQALFSYFWTLFFRFFSLSLSTYLPYSQTKSE